MTTFFFALLSSVALALCAVRDDTPAFRSHRAAVRELGVRRLLWLLLQAVVGVAVILLVTALRTSLYGALAGVAAGAAWLASLIALRRSPAASGRMELL